MTERPRRDRIIEALRQLPPDATIGEAIETLEMLSKIERGIAGLDAGEAVAHDKARRRFDSLVAAGVIRPPIEQGDPLEAWPDIRLPRGTASDLIDLGREENYP